jgi:hypothetical protein
MRTFTVLLTLAMSLTGAWAAHAVTGTSTIDVCYVWSEARACGVAKTVIAYPETLAYESASVDALWTGPSYGYPASAAHSVPPSSLATVTIKVTLPQLYCLHAGTHEVSAYHAAEGVEVIGWSLPDWSGTSSDIHIQLFCNCGSDPP